MASDLEVQVDEAIGRGVVLYKGVEYHLWDYDPYGDKKRCPHSGYCTAEVLVSLVPHPEVPNPRRYDYVVLWKCGRATWERKEPGFNMTNLFFDY